MASAKVADTQIRFMLVHLTSRLDFYYEIYFGAKAQEIHSPQEDGTAENVGMSRKRRIGKESESCSQGKYSKHANDKLTEWTIRNIVSQNAIYALPMMILF